MILFLDLRQLNLLSVIFRMLLSVFLGGLLGLEREKKRRPAGFRTYMLVCLGACMAMMIGEYEKELLIFLADSGYLSSSVDPDISRYAAQVINGIGFLGAGAIIANSKREVTGLTTASGLWAAACFGIAIGAAFYESIPAALILIECSIQGFPALERYIRRKSPYINIYIEFYSLKDLKKIIDRFKTLRVQIYHCEIERNDFSKTHQYSNAVFYAHCRRGVDHTHLVSEISDLEEVRMVREV